MPAIISLAILLVLFALSELIALKTRAMISSVLALAFLMLIGFWTGLIPATSFDDTGIKVFGNLMAGLLITSLGTTLDFPEIKRQGKVVAFALMGLLGSSLLIFLGGKLLGLQDFALAGLPIFAGGNAATLVITSALEGKGLETVVTFCIALLILQKFVGIPVASYCLRQEAKSYLKRFRSGQAETSVDTNTAATKRKLLEIPAKLQKPSTYLAKLALVTCLSFYLSGLTGGKIHFFVVCLLLGMFAFALGFLEQGILAKTQSDGLIMFLVTVLIFSNLSSTTPEMIVSIIFPLIAIMGLGVLGVIVMGLLASKVFKTSPYMAIALGISCTFGFPTTMLMPKEMATSIGSTDDERQAIESYLLPKMLVAGIVTVTIASVLMAGLVIAYF
ncbi:hypothetical protein [Streptococcus moroccensis]|uniref:Na+/glutamate symporter n=1 Tax=Streptococcus moroccensis TaxID=1451356 RepID=A0ABT9YTD2_9STRE|nr:hypothetical protein [Streptococcus moroccensis]MDQ0223238.1 hypothetical protein [Streptococcus moroccensis]